MTPQEQKAAELVERFKEPIGTSDFHLPKWATGVKPESKEYAKHYHAEELSVAKQCALICVGEIIDELETHEDGDEGMRYDVINSTKYWQQVKIEIEKL